MSAAPMTSEAIEQASSAYLTGVGFRAIHLFARRDVRHRIGVRYRIQPLDRQDPMRAHVGRQLLDEPIDERGARIC